MVPRSIKSRRILGFLTILQSLVCFVAAELILPKQLHLTSTFQSFSSQSGYKFFRIDEYIDLVSNRSSLLVDDRQLGREQIYYNQVFNDGLDRKLVEYDVNNLICKPTFTISRWAFSIIRRIAIDMYPMMELKSHLVDIAIGPSVLLYAILSTLDALIYNSTNYSRSRLSNVVVFERPIDLNSPTGNYDSLMLRVHVVTRRSISNMQTNTTLAKLLAQDTRFEISSVSVCKVVTNQLSSDSINQSKYKPNIVTSHHGSEVFEEIGCPNDKVLFYIEYNMMGSIPYGSLAGRPLEEQAIHDFHREPFVQPIGIGCWDQESLQKNYQRSFAAPTMQFSAEYSTSHGSKGLNFVAYDGYRDLLRLDRHGRKSIYDLSLRRRSFHVGEFSSARDIETNTDSLTISWLNSESSLEKCVPMDIHPDLALTSQNALLRLLGVSTNQGVSQHLGSKIIDHVPYEVFEIELKYESGEGYNMPILLEPSFTTLPRGFTRARRYYVTFYVHEYPQAQPVARSRDSPNQAIVMVPRFIELWQYSEAAKTRELLNRLTFAEFSWSLDVAPSNDPSTQMDTSRVFNIEQCYKDRASQAELVFEIKQWIFKSTREPNKLEGLAEQRPVIEEVLHERLATSLAISRLNIAQLETRVLTSGGILVKSQIVELKSGYSHLEPVGTIDLEGGVEAFILTTLYSRHSIQACMLDSLSWPTKNWMSHCPGHAACLLIEPNDGALREKIRNQRQEVSVNVSASMDYCLVYSYEWSRRVDNGESPAIEQVADRKFSLSGSEYSFKFKYQNLTTTGDEGAPQEQEGTFEGFIAQVEFNRPNSLEAKLSNFSALADMRYSTIEEEGGALNMNSRIRLAKSNTKLDSFSYCQLACQMDDLCGSFSVCLRAQKKVSLDGGKPGEDDCVLSTLRLTSDRIEQIMKMSLRSKQKKKFEVKVTSMMDSQKFVIVRDTDCSLNSKDFLAEYVIKRTRTHLPANKPPTSEPTGTKGLLQKLDIKKPEREQQQQQQPKKMFQHLSLEACAGLNFETNLQQLNGSIDEESSSSFVYCPFKGGRCLVNTATISSNVSDDNSTTPLCYVYAKEFTRFYDRKSMTHMLIKLGHTTADNSANPQTESQSRSQQPTDDSRMVDPEEAAFEMQKMQLARTYWTTSNEACARDCNLHQSKCLAFDACWREGRLLCVLFSVRSPLSPKRADTPFLPLEKNLGMSYSNGSQKDTNNNIAFMGKLYCNHYYLKAGFFEIRLRQMLDESAAQNGGGEITFERPTKERQDRIVTGESLILDEERKRNEAEQREIEIEKARRLAEIAEMKKKSQNSNSGLHFFSLTIGLLFGCLGALYGRHLINSATYLYYTRRSAHQNDGQNQLIMDNQI